MKSLFNTIMEQRSHQLMKQVGAWLPSGGPLLDLGSGTGHLAAFIEQNVGLEVVTADMTDMHIVGRSPVLIKDGQLPFNDESFSGALLCFMLAYPTNPSALLVEVARVTRGPIILVQSLYSNLLGYTWLRVREFLWSVVGFYTSKLIGYIPSGAKFTMSARRFFTPQTLQAELTAAGLRIRSRQEHSVLPNRSLVVAGWIVERDD